MNEDDEFYKTISNQTLFEPMLIRRFYLSKDKVSSLDKVARSMKSKSSMNIVNKI